MTEYWLTVFSKKQKSKQWLQVSSTKSCGAVSKIYTSLISACTIKNLTTARKPQEGHCPAGVLGGMGHGIHRGHQNTAGSGSWNAERMTVHVIQSSYQQCSLNGRSCLLSKQQCVSQVGPIHKRVYRTSKDQLVCSALWGGVTTAA